MLDTTQKVPRFFSTTLTNENGNFTHMHCLVTYEQISPVIVQQSKSRLASLEKFKFLNTQVKEDTSEIFFYVPIALCLVTTSNYIELYREVLESVYSFLSEIWQSDQIPSKELISTIEFMRISCLLLNDTIIPPADTQEFIKIGGNLIGIPVENSTGLPHIERCVAVLIDLIDIKNIISVWESLVLNHYVFFMSSNEYLLYLIFSAFNELLFPLKWSLYLVPVLGPKLKEFLSAPVPIIIGLNSNHITLNEALNANPKASILDIDSNSFYSSSESLLCNCKKEVISKKIQLVKAYYYVNRERFRCYRLNNLEKSINDVDFVNTAKMLVLKNPEEKEKVFITLIKNIFLDFFCKGLENFESHFLENAFTDEQEFNTSAFLESAELCSSCKMDKFWKSFTETSNFQQFIEWRGKYDDSYYKRFIQILQNKSQGLYSIYKQEPIFKFEIDRSISPRKLLKLLKNDLLQKPKNFENDSSFGLQLKIQKELRQYREYYRLEEGMSQYKQRKASFNINYNCTTSSKNLYYGKMGIIRLTTALLSQVSPENFKQFSMLKDYYLPYFKSQAVLESYEWSPLLVNLLFYVKDKPEEWNMDCILSIFWKLKNFNLEIENFFHIFCEIIDKMLKIMPSVYEKLEEIGGKLKFIMKTVKGEISSPITRFKSTIFNQEHVENFKLTRMNTTKNSEDSKVKQRKNFKGLSQQYKMAKLV